MPGNDVNNAGRQLLLSIHDVMPDTLDDVESIFSELNRLGHEEVTLLVVPGSGWTPASLQRLRALAQAGAELAGHGWHHVVDDIRGPRHRLHSLLISRNVAEHLALSTPQIRSLLQRCYDWFDANDIGEQINRARQPLRLLAYFIGLLLVLKVYSGLLGAIGSIPLAPRLLELVGLCTVIYFSATRLVRSR